jgi:putative Ca2+/H+ antiporter (TMEM165/GDT1 family)
MIWKTIAGSFALVAASEMGDKTMLLAFSLAGRFRRPWTVLLGIFVATLLNHALAASVGAWLAAHVPARTMAAVLAGSFIAFGIWALRPDHDADAQPGRFGPFVSTVVLFFLAEMGDKTQLATLALGARFSSAILVALSTTAGMLAADSLAVFLGDKFASKVHARWLRVGTAGLFFLFGLLSAWSAVRG